VEESAEKLKGDGENSRIVRAAGVVGTATLGSRILGFVRDMVTAFFFGTGNAADAFFVAFTIPNLLRRLFAEGTMTVSFVPVFTDYLVNRGRDEAFRVARITMTILSIVLVVIILIGIVFSPEIVFLFAPGFKGDPLKWELTVDLTRIMFPYILFVSLTALAMGVLNSMGHFLAPASAPILLNVAMIGSMFLISPLMKRPIVGLAWGVIIGGLLQVLLQVGPLIRRGVTFRLSLNYSHPAVKMILKLMLPAVFGASIYQLNVVVIRLLASMLEPGSVSYLYYADRLAQFPLGIFAVAIGTAVLPSMSKMAATGRIDELKETFTDSLSIALFITIPAAVGLIVLRVPIISLLFYRGEFDYSSVVSTAEALLYFSIGLPAVSGVRVMANGFYALKDTATPVKIGAVSIALNIVLCFLLMGPLRHGGLALAVSVAAFLNAFLLLYVFRRREGRLRLRRLFVSLVKTTIACTAMGASSMFVASFFDWELKGQILSKLIFITAAIVVGVLVYTAVTYLMGSRELKGIAKPIKEKLKIGS